MNITNPQVTSYIEEYYSPLNEKFARLRTYAETEHVPIILKDTERFLDTLLRITAPERILEIGTAIGYSGSFFAAVCGSGTRIITLESDEKMVEEAGRNIADLGFDTQIEIIYGDARETAKTVEGVFDFIFIDAAKSHYRAFWDAVIEKTHKGSVIVCDNILMRAQTVSDEYDPLRKHRTNIRKMREFLDYICKYENASTSLLSIGDGVSVSVVK